MEAVLVGSGRLVVAVHTELDEAPDGVEEDEASDDKEDESARDEAWREDLEFGTLSAEGLRVRTGGTERDPVSGYSYSRATCTVPTKHPLTVVWPD